MPKEDIYRPWGSSNRYQLASATFKLSNFQDPLFKFQEKINKLGLVFNNFP